MSYPGDSAIDNLFGTVDKSLQTLASPQDQETSKIALRKLSPPIPFSFFGRNVVEESTLLPKIQLLDFFVNPYGTLAKSTRHFLLLFFTKLIIFLTVLFYVFSKIGKTVFSKIQGLPTALPKLW